VYLSTRAFLTTSNAAIGTLISEHSSDQRWGFAIGSSAKHQLIEDTSLEMRFGEILCGIKKEGWQPSEPPPHIWIDQGVVLEELLVDESEEELLSFLLFLLGLDSDFSESVIPLFFPA
jgi:hypothetical protein